MGNRVLGKKLNYKYKETRGRIGKAYHAGFAVLRSRVDILWPPYLGGSFNISLLLKEE